MIFITNNSGEIMLFEKLAGMLGEISIGETCASTRRELFSGISLAWCCRLRGA